MTTLGQIRFVWKPIVFLACLVPAALVVGDAFEITGQLGANPIENIQDRFGNWGLRFILLTLAVTPLRRLTGWNWLLRFRRMLGLFTFFYVFLHFLTWLFLDQGLLLSAILEDIVERPFITIGFAAFVLLSVLAATSTNGIRRRLGRRWHTLHYGVYAVGNPRRLALLVAGKEGYRRTADLRGHTGHTPRLSPVALFETG